MSVASPPLVIGIVLYKNKRADLMRLLESLEVARRDGPVFRITWFDNSADASAADEWRGLGVEPFVSSTNVGFGRAHNHLMAEAFGATSTRWYLCLNPDALVHPSMIIEMVSQLRRMPRPGLVEAAQFPDEHPKVYHPDTNETGWCSGCSLLVTRELYEAVGGFDDNIFLYCEDVDLSWRARAAGFGIATAPRALVYHFTGDRPPGGRTRIEMVKAGAYLAAKWGDAAFRKRCADEYRELTGEVLKLPSVSQPTARMRAVADFSQSFHFTTARW